MVIKLHLENSQVNARLAGTDTESIKYNLDMEVLKRKAEAARGFKRPRKLRKAYGG